MTADEALAILNEDTEPPVAAHATPAALTDAELAEMAGLAPSVALPAAHAAPAAPAAHVELTDAELAELLGQEPVETAHVAAPAAHVELTDAELAELLVVAAPRPTAPVRAAPTTTLLALRARHGRLRTYYKLGIAQSIWGLLQCVARPDCVELGLSCLSYNTTADAETSFFVRNKYVNGPDGLLDILCQRNVVERLEIGACFNDRPATVAGRTPDGSLVRIDMDVDDYDRAHLRGCGCGKGMCARCARFLLVAATALEAGLTALAIVESPVRLLLIDSGRRGMHAYWLDADLQHLRSLPAVARGVLEHIAVFDGMGALVGCDYPLVPAVAAMVEVLAPVIDELTADHDVWRRQPAVDALLTAIDDVAQRAAAREAIAAAVADGSNPWDAITAVLNDHQRARVILFIAAPRLDLGALHPTHLLKAPFAVHPTTGRISAPILPDHAFDPATAPTLDAVLATPDLLTPYIRYFDQRVAEAVFVPM